jgi:hypothetical protein
MLHPPLFITCSAGATVASGDMTAKRAKLDAPIAAPVAPVARPTASAAALPLPPLLTVNASSTAANALALSPGMGGQDDIFDKIFGGLEEDMFLDSMASSGQMAMPPLNPLPAAVQAPPTAVTPAARSTHRAASVPVAAPVAAPVASAAPAPAPAPVVKKSKPKPPPPPPPAPAPVPVVAAPEAPWIAGARQILTNVSRGCVRTHSRKHTSQLTHTHTHIRICLYISVTSPAVL